MENFKGHTEAGGGKKRLPSYLRRPLGKGEMLHGVKKILRKRNLHTVCESARCPNIGECFSKPTAAFLILGDVCTRNCGFCGVGKNLSPAPPSRDEPLSIAMAAKELKLKHVVITSVTRDDLKDGGAAQFALTIRALRDNMQNIFIEVLTPDFSGNPDALKAVFGERPDIFNHNLETVPRLYPRVRPMADYSTSLGIILKAKEAGLLAKSGIMVGLGEKKEEVKEVLKGLLDAGCDCVTIGQYLQPTRANLEVKDYVAGEVFKEYEEYGKGIGIRYVYSGPFVRSSYNAEEIFRGLKKAVHREG